MVVWRSLVSRTVYLHNWYYGGPSCVFLPIEQRKSLPWSEISPENRFSILCSLPLVAHQLASAREFSHIYGPQSPPTFAESRLP